jgi:hypothetical protein
LMEMGGVGAIVLWESLYLRIVFSAPLGREVVSCTSLMADLSMPFLRFFWFSDAFLLCTTKTRK